MLLPPPPPLDVDWDRDVKPILSQHCFQCHGFDAAARQADLRLDVPEVREDPRGVIVPGSPEKSLLLQRVHSEDASEQMPPPEIGKDLNEEQKRVLAEWIAAGAPYANHWSFQPIPSEAPGSIDRFVAAGLADLGLDFSPLADKRTLIRRVTFDLTGMPPTPAEVDAFLADDSADAYGKVVDRLLASDAYAERMALAWMDAARYGDTSVYHADGPRDMWPWRDWVIRAYKSNLAFDDFTTWQLAGDLLPEPTLDQRIASGFHRNNGTSDEGGAIDEELRVSYIVDRVKTTGSVWLGLSMECAQCHDHKYDPVSQVDYYRFYGLFNQANEDGFQTRNGNEPPFLRVPTEEQNARTAELTSRIATMEASFAEVTAPEELFRAWVGTSREELAKDATPELGTWQVMGPFTGGSANKVHNTRFGPEDAEVPTDFTVEGKAWAAKPDYPEGKAQTLGSAGNAAMYLYRSIEATRAATIAASLGSDDTIRVWLNGEELLAKEVYRGTQPDQERVELNLKPSTNHFLMKIVNGGGPSGFYFKLLASPLPDAIVKHLRAGDDNGDAVKALRAYHKTDVWDEGKKSVADIAALQQERTGVENSVATVMVLEDRAMMRPTYVLDRGQYDSPLRDQEVQPGVLEHLLPMPEGAPSNRLGLAQWLTDPEHPLTSRVAVNRYWSMFFGRGLVDTVMDFGAQGSYPTHPELLDWLARDFIASDWDVKRMLRQIVTSRTYCQSSHRRYDVDDPENVHLARSARFRLQGEFLRDQALATSGLLVDEVGGPGVKPYQPPGLWNEVSLNRGLRFTRDTGEKLYRKSMYIYWKRSAPMPAMTIFDAPTREKCIVQRQRTNTPLQALVVMNDEQFVEAARHLAARMMAAGDSFEERLDAGFLLLTSRPADELRRDTLHALLQDLTLTYQANPEDAVALLSVGESPRDENLDPAEHAAWTMVASTLLNLDETLTRD